MVNSKQFTCLSRSIKTLNNIVSCEDNLAILVTDSVLCILIHRYDVVFVLAIKLTANLSLEVTVHCMRVEGVFSHETNRALAWPRTHCRRSSSRSIEQQGRDYYHQYQLCWRVQLHSPDGSSTMRRFAGQTMPQVTL